MVLSRFVRNSLLIPKRFSSKDSRMDTHEYYGNFWRKISLYLCLPSVFLTSIYVYFIEKEHAQHPRPKFVPYEYLNIHKSDYQWGDGKHSLFFNPVRNTLPTGYEVPDPNEGKSHH